eukprot:COSAG05_NODE_16538_length_344_cov_0.514286_1_plen_114_part_11
MGPKRREPHRLPTISDTTYSFLFSFRPRPDADDDDQDVEDDEEEEDEDEEEAGEVFQVEAVVGKRLHSSGKNKAPVLQYEVRWAGYSDAVSLSLSLSLSVSFFQCFGVGCPQHL